MSRMPYTSRAQQALTHAERSAAMRGDAFIGTEHLLLGLLTERTGPAAQFLGHLGVTSAKIEELLSAARSQG